MNRPNTLPGTAEQARHALLLIGAPAPARLVVDVHAALFDGDLSVPALTALIRDRAPGVCAALHPDLTAARGLVALPDWPTERRIVTPAARRADSLIAVLRIAEFVAARPFADRSAARLLSSLADRWAALLSSPPDRPAAGSSPVGRPAVGSLSSPADGVLRGDLAEAARAALADPALAAAVAAEDPIRSAAAARAADLDETQRLFGLPALPHQRGGA